MPSILCRHGGTDHTHTSVAQVRECQGVLLAQQPPEEEQWSQPGIGPQGDVYVSSYKTNQDNPNGPGPNDRPTEEGYFFYNNTYYKVVISQGTGRPYALAADEVHGKWKWKYAKGAIYNLRRRHELTPEQVKAFGALSGQCIYCMQRLTRQESIDRGYGPICADNRGLPYDHSAP